ncbi:MAG: hypothetical protein MZW92_23015 [Comamonadaceae bacterium]|nr:hypothetical protein [Comamonadaceae bacterium]
MMDVHHRQDAARRRHGVLRPDHRPAAPDRAARSRRLGIGRKFQKPTVFEQLHGVREPRTGDEDRQARARRRCSRSLTRRAARPHRRARWRRSASKDERAAHGRAAVATARSSGWRSACC